MTDRDYRPLDLDPVRNSPASILADGETAEIGERLLHGLPFDFGAERERCILRLAPGDAAAEVPIDTPANWLIFAHAIADTDLFDHGDVGVECARYRLVFDDGTAAEFPVRQRYEIGPSPRRWDGRPIPLDWGHTPFLAVLENEQKLMDRTQGRYDAAGARLVQIDDPQSRVPYVLPYRYYLWALSNPQPDRRIARLEIVATTRTLLVGAVTASGLDEEPFSRNVAETVLLDCGWPVTERTEVQVDRGLSTYCNPCVPAVDVLPGWGVPLTDMTSGFVEIAALPSATILVLEAGEERGRCRMSDLLDGGTVNVGTAATMRLVDRDRAWIRTTVRDAQTGDPVPCRIRFRSAAGIPYAPYGHHPVINSGNNTWNLDIGGDVRLGAATYAQIEGTCEGWLPMGRVEVEVARGFEYEPIRREVEIKPGQTTLDLTLHRIADLRAEGYLCADTHVHFVSTQGAELEARCEDIDIVHLLLSQWGHLHTSTEEFTGRPHVSADGRTIVFAGQENRSNMLGHIHILGADTRILPWCTGGAEEAAFGGGMETTASHWADRCHAHGGLLVLAHFPVPNGEIAALVATGRADAVEMIAYDDFFIGEYYRYLNDGYRLPLVAGTDKMTAEVAIGQMRTYARTDSSEVSLDAWSRAVKDGRTFITSGPLIELNVNGAEPGAEVDASSGTIDVTAEARSILPLDRIELVMNGQVVATSRSGKSSTHLVMKEGLRVGQAGWIAVRCFAAPGMDRHADVWERPVMAHSSPIYLRHGDKTRPSDPATTRYMLALCEGVKLHLENRATRFWPGRVTHVHGETGHLKHLVRPIDEAIANLSSKLDRNTEN